MMKCHFSYIEQGNPVSLEEFSNINADTGDRGYQLYVDNCFTGLLQVSVLSSHSSSVKNPKKRKPCYLLQTACAIRMDTLHGGILLLGIPSNICHVIR